MGGLRVAHFVFNTIPQMKAPGQATSVERPQRI